MSGLCEAKAAVVLLLFSLILELVPIGYSNKGFLGFTEAEIWQSAV